MGTGTPWTGWVLTYHRTGPSTRSHRHATTSHADGWTGRRDFRNLRAAATESDRTGQGPAAGSDEKFAGRTDPAFQFESHDEREDVARSGGGAHRGPAGIASEGPLDPDSDADSPYRTLVCPDCGFSESATTSLRAGDICPECHRGYLAGRR